MTTSRSEVASALRTGLAAHVDDALEPAGFARRATSTVYHRAFPGVKQSLRFNAARRTGRPTWRVGARFEVDLPEVRPKAIELAAGLPQTVREGIATDPMFFFGIDEIWGIASGSWYVVPAGVTEFMVKVSRHLTNEIMPLTAGFSSVAELAVKGVPEGVPRNYRDPLMIAACRCVVGDTVRAREALATGFDRDRPGNEWVTTALEAIG